MPPPARFAIVLVVTVLLGGCDARTRRDEVTGPPQRIVSLTLASDEMLAAFDIDERVVAVTRFADQPEHSNVVGRWPDSTTRLIADFERIAALEPDLVCVADFTLEETLARFADSSIPVHRVGTPRDFDEMKASLRALAAAVGEVDAGRRIEADIDRRLAALRRRLDGVERPRVLAWTAGFCYGDQTSVNALIEAAGGLNALAAFAVIGCVPVPEERLLEIGCDVLLIEGKPGSSTAELPQALRALEAVRAGRVHYLDGPLFSTLSQHLLRGAETLARALHPTRFVESGR